MQVFFGFFCKLDLGLISRSKLEVTHCDLGLTALHWVGLGENRESNFTVALDESHVNIIFFTVYRYA